MQTGALTEVRTKFQVLFIKTTGQVCCKRLLRTNFPICTLAVRRLGPIWNTCCVGVTICHSLRLFGAYVLATNEIPVDRSALGNKTRSKLKTP
jgi:hypothetical protein